LHFLRGRERQPFAAILHQHTPECPPDPSSVSPFQSGLMAPHAGKAQFLGKRCNAIFYGAAGRPEATPTRCYLSPNGWCVVIEARRVAQLRRNVTSAFSPPNETKVPHTCHSERSEESAFSQGLTTKADSSSLCSVGLTVMGFWPGTGRFSCLFSYSFRLSRCRTNRDTGRPDINEGE
jgi:hypothetical protein